jgi:hypothetical protein
MAITASNEKRVEGWDGRPIVAYMFTKRQSGESYEYWLLNLSGNCCIVSYPFALPSGGVGMVEGRRAR